MVAKGQKPAAWVLFAGGRLSKESYCSRDSFWGKEAFPAAVTAHGGGERQAACSGGVSAVEEGGEKEGRREGERWAV